jgi:hypothetical protein
MREHIANLIEVKYEDLVWQTEKEVRRICEFIGIEFSNKMIDYYKDVDKNIDGDTLALEHLQNIRKPVSTDSIGKWKKEFTSEEKMLVDRLLRRYLVESGYEKSL